MKATFGAGCFWGVEEAFQKLGDTIVGYAGGHKKDPTYEDVCTDQTGHAEVVQVSSDKPYKELLQVFWSCHDPTQKNRQGPDVGSQYRSIILYHSEEQKKEARRVTTEYNDFLNEWKDKLMNEAREQDKYGLPIRKIK